MAGPLPVESTDNAKHFNWLPTNIFQKVWGNGEVPPKFEFGDVWFQNSDFYHRIIESWNGLGWKEPYRSSRSKPPAMGRDTFHQTRLLQAPSNLALNTAREGAPTASLGNLFQGLTALIVKTFFLISNVNLPSFSLKSLPLVLSLRALMKNTSPSFWRETFSHYVWICLMLFIPVSATHLHITDIMSCYSFSPD